MEDIISALKEARELITDHSKWCKGAFARDRVGIPVFPVDVNACCWCAEGALGKVTTENENYCLNECKTQLSKTVGRHFTFWHDADKRTHEEVLEVFDKTIRRLESELH